MKSKGDDTRISTIIVYDGLCNMCNRSLRFIQKHDFRDQFTYIPFQSAQGQLICGHFDIEFTESTSLLLIENRELFSGSIAWQKILGRLSFGYRLLSFVMRVIPAILSDKVYEFVGSRRYRWFGKSLSCQLVEQTPLPATTAIEKQLQSHTE